MSRSQQHYDALLASVYSWMVGDRRAAELRQREIIESTCLRDAERGIAIDLGAGTGLQSVPLAEMGFEVVALDLSPSLLAELDAVRGDLPVRTVVDDLSRFDQHAHAPVSAIVCMGDTLTHLPSREAVRTLLQSVSTTLAPGAPFLATFRDYATRQLTGPQRFIPVRSDDHRIMTCFLEYGPETVEVHDLVYEHGAEGWKFRASSYPKLRLNPADAAGWLEEAGMRVVQHDTVYGMARIVAVRA